MLIDAVILSMSGLNVLVTLAGVLIGMTAAAVVIREHFVSQRALSIEHDLREGLGRLERQRVEPQALDEVIRRQELAVQRVRGYADRRVYFYRLLFGYLALISLGLLALWLLLETQDVSLHSGVLRWFGIGLACAVAVNLLAYTFATMRRLMTSSLLALRPMSIPLDRELELPRELDIEASIRSWLESRDFQVRAAKPQSGLDLIAERGGATVLVEVKAIPLLTVDDVDAVIGAAARLLGPTSMEAAKVLIVVPSEALGSSASSAMRAAEEQGIEIVTVDDGGQVDVATSDGWSGQMQIA